MRRRFLRVTLVLIFLVAAVLLLRVVAAPKARPALGFAAKVVCSSVFLGNTTPARAIADLPDEPIARLLRVRVDSSARRVRASFPLLTARTAAYHPGIGCVLQPSVPFPVLTDPRAPSAAAGLPWPDGERVDMPALSPAQTAALHAAIDDAFAEPDTERMRNTRAIVVVHEGRIVAERYATGFNAASRLAGWSMTKSVTNALVGILVAEGRLTLDTAALRAEWRGPDDARRAITLDQLLRMSSGLDFRESYAPTGDATRMLFDAPDTDDAAAATPLAAEPGSRWYYSSGTTNIIAQLIRDVVTRDGSDYHTWPRRALFDRIAMHTAVLEPDPAGTFVGSSFMYATARDWARFGLLFLHDGVWKGARILPEGWVQYSVTPAAAAPLGQYGAHWWLNSGEAADSTRRTWPYLPPDIFFASGFQGQYVVVLPAHDLVVVRLGITRHDEAWSLGRFLQNVINALQN